MNVHRGIAVGASPTSCEDDVVLVGFGSWAGSVEAGERWGAPMRRMSVPPARPGSWEDLLHNAIGRDVLFLTDELLGEGAARERRGHRAMGAVYDPAREAWGNYVPTDLPARYEAFIYLERTEALRPLHAPTDRDGELPETYPSGF